MFSVDFEQKKQMSHLLFFLNTLSLNRRFNTRAARVRQKKNVVRQAGRKILIHARWYITTFPVLLEKSCRNTAPQKKIVKVIHRGCYFTQQSTFSNRSSAKIVPAKLRVAGVFQLGFGRFCWRESIPRQCKHSQRLELLWKRCFTHPHPST